MTMSRQSTTNTTEQTTHDRTEIVDYLKDENERLREEVKLLRQDKDKWRLQAEASNRALSEVSVALRKALTITKDGS